MNKVLVFDTETNGKAKDFNRPMTDLDNWPRITQIAWGVWDSKTDEVKYYESLIKPDGWTVPTTKFFLENNMSTERCEEEGKPLIEVLEMFISSCEECDVLVAHNMSFDHPVVGAEMIRTGLRLKSKIPKFCTMKSTTDLCKLPGRYGNYKWPTLTELHTHLFNCEFDGAHDALDDVRACLTCFKEIYLNEHITIK
jgi:DNA polymerase III epsilon subunit-like protein